MFFELSPAEMDLPYDITSYTFRDHAYITISLWGVELFKYEEDLDNYFGYADEHAKAEFASILAGLIAEYQMRNLKGE